MSAKNVQFVPQLGPVSRYCSRSRGGISVASCAAGLPVNADRSVTAFDREDVADAIEDD
ncbi:hypothetical protein [Natrinema gelatinilyticum]|uniref:hypothetical protein n=1 Tax=Natrinema gelatinilyticum TaxID=2961571 RepID=UPI0020C3A1F5|nr:hypothetical protein [Natrinema gelatinilyticum]